MTNEQEREVRLLLMKKVDGVLLQAGNPGPEVTMDLPPGWELERIGIENGAEVLELKVRISVLQGATSTPKTRGGLPYLGMGEHQMSICPDQTLRANSTGHLHIRLLVAHEAGREPLQKLCTVVHFTGRSDLLGLVGVRQCGPRREKVRSRRKSNG